MPAESKPTMGQPKTHHTTRFGTETTPGPNHYTIDNKKNYTVWSQKPGNLFGNEGVDKDEAAIQQASMSKVGPGSYNPKTLPIGMSKIILGARQELDFADKVPGPGTYEADGKLKKHVHSITIKKSLGEPR